MKKKSFFKKTLSLGLAGVLGVTSIFSLASCNGVPTEKVETENLTKLSNTQALADTTTTWKSLNSIASEWENVSEGITIPAGTTLRLNGNEGCLRSENDDDCSMIDWIVSNFDCKFELFKEVATQNGNNYTYKYALDNGNIEYHFIFNNSNTPQCGDSWFDDAEVYLDEVEIYFSGEMVYTVDADFWCAGPCDLTCQSLIDTDKTVTLENDLYIKTYKECSDENDFYYVYHTMCDSFDYSIPGTIEAGTKIKITNPDLLIGQYQDEIANEFRAMLVNEFDSFTRFMDLDNHAQQFEEGLGMDIELVDVDENTETVYLHVPIYIPQDTDYKITYEIAITSGAEDTTVNKCCSIWSDGGYLKAFAVKMGSNTLASIDTTSEGCIVACEYYDYTYDANEFTLPEDYVVGDGSYTTIPNFCKSLFDGACSYLIDLQAPSLSGSNTFTVNVDSLLTQDEILSHVVATDDTDTTPEIVVESSTYTAAKQIGTFYIYVHAVDDAGNVSPTYTLTINVKDSTSPTISTTTRTVGNNVVLSQDELLALFTAKDNYYSSSDLTIELITDSYTSKSKVPGTYEVIAKATDPSGNYSTKSTSVTVTDATAPTITATNKTTGNNAKLSDVELKALFTYNDDVTGTSALKFEYTLDNYSANYNKLGTYQVTAKVTDEAGNYSSATANITVEDKTSPTISSTNKTTVYNTLLSEAELKALFTYSDDVSATDNITLTITANTYTASYNKLGTYQVTAKVVDENNNEASATANITVVDNVKPIITGADINITNATILTEEQIRNYYKVNDAYDGELQFTLTWVKNYLETPSKVGVYSFTISASDSSNNPISQTFNLNVTDGIVPELWLDNYFIVVDTNTEVTQELLVAYAAASLCVAEADIVSVDGSFDNSEAGIYILSAKLADGTEKPIKLSIVEGAEIPTEEAKYDFNIKDIFNGEFWSNYASGWTNNFAWPHWTTIGLAVLMLGALVIAIRKRK